MSAQFFNDNFSQFLQDAANDALQKMGRANIIIVGGAGVGKSTLINAVFQGNLATTGVGRPVTTSTREYKKDDIPLSIFDTQGIEKDKFDDMLAALGKFLQERKKSSDHNQHIHIAWLCILEAPHRVEDADIAFVQMLSKYTSVVCVITQAINDNGFRREVIRLIPEAKNVVRVLALDMPVGDDGYIAKAKGLDELVNLTMEIVPDVVKNGLARSLNMKIQAALDSKRQRAHLAVATAAASAAAVGAAPIPIADAVLIVPIQFSMLATISAIWGLPVSQTFLSTIVSGSATGSIATVGGRALVGTLLKFIPGIGSLTGGLISASVAATITTAFGEAYIATLYALAKSHPDRMPTAEEIKDEFQRRLNKAPKEPNLAAVVRLRIKDEFQRRLNKA